MRSASPKHQISPSSSLFVIEMPRSLGITVIATLSLAFPKLTVTFAVPPPIAESVKPSAFTTAELSEVTTISELLTVYLSGVIDNSTVLLSPSSIHSAVRASLLVMLMLISSCAFAHADKTKNTQLTHISAANQIFFFILLFLLHKFLFNIRV